MTSMMHFSLRIVTLMALALLVSACGGGSVQDASSNQRSGVGVGNLSFEAPPTPGKQPSGTGG